MALPSPVARTKTKKEAEAKARKYIIKPKHRLIKKESGVWKGKTYKYVVYVKD